MLQVVGEGEVGLDCTIIDILAVFRPFGTRH